MYFFTKNFSCRLYESHMKHQSVYIFGKPALMQRAKQVSFDLISVLHIKPDLCPRQFKLMEVRSNFARVFKN